VEPEYGQLLTFLSVISGLKPFRLIQLPTRIHDRTPVESHSGIDLWIFISLTSSFSMPGAPFHDLPSARRHGHTSDLGPKASAGARFMRGRLVSTRRIAPGAGSRTADGSADGVSAQGDGGPLGRWRPGLPWRCPVWLPPARRVTTRRRPVGENGLLTNASAPDANAAVSLASAETMTTARWPSPGASRSIRQRVSPSNAGIITSSTARSNGSVVNDVNALSPSAASTTSCPSPASVRMSRSRILSESSAMRIRAKEPS
jgi:hypothetical protein